MSASVIQPQVQRMIENPGVYVAGDTNRPDITLIIVSVDGILFSTVLDMALAPDGFYDTFVVKHGPFK